eukprot:ANDGO_05636.mRNA.1 hypothetical protein
MPRQQSSGSAPKGLLFSGIAVFFSSDVPHEIIEVFRQNGGQSAKGGKFASFVVSSNANDQTVRAMMSSRRPQIVVLPAWIEKCLLVSTLVPLSTFILPLVATAATTSASSSSTIATPVASSSSTKPPNATKTPVKQVVGTEVSKSPYNRAIGEPSVDSAAVYQREAAGMEPKESRKRSVRSVVRAAESSKNDNRNQDNDDDDGDDDDDDRDVRDVRDENGDDDDGNGVQSPEKLVEDGRRGRKIRRRLIDETPSASQQQVANVLASLATQEIAENIEESQTQVDASLRPRIGTSPIARHSPAHSVQRIQRHSLLESSTSRSLYENIPPYANGRASPILASADHNRSAYTLSTSMGLGASSSSANGPRAAPSIFQMTKSLSSGAFLAVPRTMSSILRPAALPVPGANTKSNTPSSQLFAFASALGGSRFSAPIPVPLVPNPLAFTRMPAVTAVFQKR